MHPPLLSSFSLRNVDYAVVNFNVARPDVEQLVDSYTGSPEHTQHEVVPLAALLRRQEHVIDLLLFEVVCDVLH